MDDVIVIVIGTLSVLLGILIGGLIIKPTELPNGCILHNDAIYCVQEVAE